MVAPGPRVTNATPGWPVNFAYASAMNVAPDSCRLTISLTISRESYSASSTAQETFAGHGESVIDALDQQLIDEQAGAGAGRHGAGV